MGIGSHIQAKITGRMPPIMGKVLDMQADR